MKIIYDDLNEFAEVVIRCNNTVEKGKCGYCPFYDRCDIASMENRHIMCAEIEQRTEQRSKNDT